jgi:hypothetical protein
VPAPFGVLGRVVTAIVPVGSDLVYSTLIDRRNPMDRATWPCFDCRGAGVYDFVVGAPRPMQGARRGCVHFLVILIRSRTRYCGVATAMSKRRIMVTVHGLSRRSWKRDVEGGFKSSGEEAPWEFHHFWYNRLAILPLVGSFLRGRLVRRFRQALCEQASDKADLLVIFASGYGMNVVGWSLAEWPPVHGPTIDLLYCNPGLLNRAFRWDDLIRSGRVNQIAGIDPADATAGVWKGWQSPEWRQIKGYLLGVGALFSLPLLLGLTYLLLPADARQSIGPWIFRGYGILILPAIIYIARRLSSQTAEQVRSGDRRPPVLYLRSFRDDDGFRPDAFSLSLHGPATSFEEALAKLFSELGPVIAIGQPGEENLPTIGAARLYVSHERWQSEVEKLVGEARAVVYLLCSTPGARWEFRRILDLGASRKLILVFPPVSLAELQTRWLALMAELGDACPFTLPPDPGPRAIYGVFTTEGHLCLFESPNIRREQKQVLFGLSCYSGPLDELRRFLDAPGRPTEAQPPSESPAASPAVENGSKPVPLSRPSETQEARSLPRPAPARNSAARSRRVGSTLAAGLIGVVLGAQLALRVVAADDHQNYDWTSRVSFLTLAILGGGIGVLLARIAIRLRPFGADPRRGMRALVGGSVVGVVMLGLALAGSVMTSQERAIAEELTVVGMMTLMGAMFGGLAGYFTDQA